MILSLKRKHLVRPPSRPCDLCGFSKGKIMFLSVRRGMLMLYIFLYFAIGGIVSPLYIFLIYLSEKYIALHPKLKSPFSPKPFRYRAYFVLIRLFNIFSYLLITPWLSLIFAKKLVNLILEHPPVSSSSNYERQIHSEFYKNSKERKLDDLYRKYC